MRKKHINNKNLNIKEKPIEIKEILESKDLPSVYQKFIKDLPKEALRTEVTDKGEKFYLFGYQFVVNRLNETVGLDHWNYEILGEIEKEKKGPLWWVSLQLRLSLGNWINGFLVPLVYKDAFGSGIHESLGNAKKGAVTNALKKAAGMFGLGKKAYEGLIEEFDVLNPSHKVLEAKEMLMTKDESEKTKSLEILFLGVSSKESCEKALSEYEKLKPSLNNKQIKYLEFIITRLTKKFQMTLKI